MTPIGNQDFTQPPIELKTSQRYFRTNRRDISYLRFILEAYEGVAVLTTMDARSGIVKVLMAPGSERLVTHVLDDLCGNGDIMLEPLPDDPFTELRDV